MDDARTLPHREVLGGRVAVSAERGREDDPAVRRQRRRRQLLLGSGGGGHSGPLLRRQGQAALLGTGVGGSGTCTLKLLLRSSMAIMLLQPPPMTAMHARAACSCLLRIT